MTPAVMNTVCSLTLFVVLAGMMKLMGRLPSHEEAKAISKPNTQPAMTPHPYAGR